MSVRIVLVTRNGLPIVEESLSAIASYSGGAQVSLLDNGSTDGTSAVLRAWAMQHNAELLISETNTGFSAAYNALLRQGSEPYLLVLNQDAVLSSGYVDALEKVLGEVPELASVSGTLLRRDDVVTNVIDAQGLTIHATGRVVERNRGQQFKNSTTELQYGFGNPATATLYRRSALQSIALGTAVHPQYFDEHFFAYKEDVDLAYRLALAGWKSAVLPNVVASHIRSVRGIADDQQEIGGRRTAAAWLARTDLQQYLSYRNHLYFLFGTALVRRNYVSLPLVIMYEKIKAFMVLITRPRQFFRAWGEVFGNREYLKEKRKHTRALKRVQV
ncbi:MAG: glycosyltransferase [Patescibacteria group bacterium]